MPFDGPLPPSDDPLALYRQRRQACGDRWLLIPPRRFRLTEWHCGTVGCALGWLGFWEYDGWRLVDFLPGEQMAAWDGKRGLVAAAMYFALAVPDARMCFSGRMDTATFHGRSSIYNVTPADVARSLLALPYTVPAMEGAAA